MRVFTEVSVTLKGDEAAARRNIPLARTLLGIMKSVNTKTNAVQRWRRTLPDGTKVDLASFHGRDYIQIESPSGGADRFYGGILYYLSLEESFLWAAPEFETPTEFTQEKRSYYVRDDAYSWDPEDTSYLNGAVEVAIPASRGLIGVWDHASLGTLILTYTTGTTFPTFEIFQVVDGTWDILHSHSFTTGTTFQLDGVTIEDQPNFSIQGHRPSTPFTYAPGGGQVWFMLECTSGVASGCRLLVSITNIASNGAANFSLEEHTGILAQFELKDRVNAELGPMQWPRQSPVVESARIEVGPSGFDVYQYVSGKYLIDIGYADGQLKKIYFDIQGPFISRTTTNLDYTPPGLSAISEPSATFSATGGSETTGFTASSVDAAGTALASLLNTNQSSGGRYSYTYISSTDDGILSQTFATAASGTAGGDIRIDRFDNVTSTTTQVTPASWSFTKIVPPTASGESLNIGGTIATGEGGTPYVDGPRILDLIEMIVPVGHIRHDTYNDDSVIYDVVGPYHRFDFLSPEIRHTESERTFENECVARFIDQNDAVFFEVPSTSFIPSAKGAPGAESFFITALNLFLPSGVSMSEATYVFAPYTAENLVQRYNGPIVSSPSFPFYSVYGEGLIEWEITMDYPAIDDLSFVIDLVDAETSTLVVTLVPQEDTAPERSFMSSGSAEGDFDPEDPLPPFDGVYTSSLNAYLDGFLVDEDVEFLKDWEESQVIIRAAIIPPARSITDATSVPVETLSDGVKFSTAQSRVNSSILYKSGKGAAYKDPENYAVLWSGLIEDSTAYDATPLTFAFENGELTMSPFGITTEVPPVYALYNISRETT